MKKRLSGAVLTRFQAANSRGCDVALQKARVAYSAELTCFIKGYSVPSATAGCAAGA